MGRGSKGGFFSAPSHPSSYHHPVVHHTVAPVHHTTIITHHTTTHYGSSHHSVGYGGGAGVAVTASTATTATTVASSSGPTSTYTPPPPLPDPRNPAAPAGVEILRDAGTGEEYYEKYAYDEIVCVERHDCRAYIGLCGCLACIIYFITILVLTFSNIPDARKSDSYSLHTSEMRLIELPSKGEYTSSESTISGLDSVPGGFRVYSADSEPAVTGLPISTPAATDSYDFPSECDFWFQNAWLPAGSTLSVKATCTAESGDPIYGIASISTVSGPNWPAYYAAANCETDSTAPDAEAYVESTHTIEYPGAYPANSTATMSHTQTDAAGSVWYIAIKKVGTGLECHFATTFSFVRYDLSSLSEPIYSKTSTRGGDSSATVDSASGKYALLVSVAPSANASASLYSDFSVGLKQNTPAALHVGPMIGILFAGMIFIFCCEYLSRRFVVRKERVDLPHWDPPKPKPVPVSEPAAAPLTASKTTLDGSGGGGGVELQPVGAGGAADVAGPVVVVGADPTAHTPSVIAPVATRAISISVPHANAEAVAPPALPPVSVAASSGVAASAPTAVPSSILVPIPVVAVAAVDAHNVQPPPPFDDPGAC